MSKIYERGDKIIAFWVSKEWHHATVSEVNNNGTYTVTYDDGVTEDCVVCDHIQPMTSGWSEKRIERHCRSLGIDMRVKNTLRKRKLTINSIWKNTQHKLRGHVS